jgi:hypothetical protein
MEKKIAEKLISMLDDEISSLQRAKAEILKSVNDGTEKAEEGPYARISTNTQKIHEVLLEAGRGMSPKELHALLIEKGVDIEQARMRQILHQNKKKYFQSVKRGVWKARVVEK